MLVERNAFVVVGADIAVGIGVVDSSIASYGNIVVQEAWGTLAEIASSAVVGMDEA